MENDLAGIGKQLLALDKSEINAWLKRGRLLTEARELCTGDRDFAGWLRTYSQARTTAYKAMAAWRDFGTVPTSGQISKEAMALLAGHADAINDAIKISETSRVTAKIAKKLVGRPALLEPLDAGDVDSVGAVGDRTRVYTGEGWKCSITLDHAGTDSDFMAALSQAMKQHQTQGIGISRLLGRAG